MNGCALIFRTNQKQQRLVCKELGIHDDTFVAVQLKNTAADTLHPLGAYFYTVL